MYRYDLEMLGKKIEETNVSSSYKCQVSSTMPLCHIFNLSGHAYLWKMAHKKVNNLSTKKEYYQFQVPYLSYLNLKQNKEFKEQAQILLSN